MSSAALSLPSPAARIARLPWLPFLPLLAIPVTGTSPESLDRVIVAMELIFLVMAIYNPLWVLGALMVSELTIRNYHLELLISLLIILPHLSRGADLGPKARPMVIVAASFILVATIADALVTDFAHAFTPFRSIVVGFVAVILVPLVIKSREDLLEIGLVALIIATVSAVVAILQHFSGGPIFNLATSNVPGASVVWGGRSQGLTENPIRLSNDLMLFLFPVIGVVLTRGTSGNVSRYLIVIALTIAAALYFSETRSWVPSALAATTALTLVLRGRFQKQLLLLLAITLLLSFGVQLLGIGRYGRDLGEDSSWASRPVLWTAAFNMALDHPVLGVGHDRFRELAPRYARTIAPGLLAHEGAGTNLGRFDAHNDYLNVWVSFGAAALVLYGLLLVFIGSNFLSAARHLSDPLLKGIALGSLGVLVAFAVNSFFHNLFGTTMTVWILAGLSLALTKLAWTETGLKTEPMP